MPQPRRLCPWAPHFPVPSWQPSSVFVICGHRWPLLVCFPHQSRGRPFQHWQHVWHEVLSEMLAEWTGIFLQASRRTDSSYLLISASVTRQCLNSFFKLKIGKTSKVRHKMTQVIKMTADFRHTIFHDSSISRHTYTCKVPFTVENKKQLSSWKFWTI